MDVNGDTEKRRSVGGDAEREGAAAVPAVAMAARRRDV